MRRLRFELAAMAFIVMLAGLSVFATFGSARSGDLVFCRMVGGGVVVGVTTDCSDAIDGASIVDPSSASPVTVVGAPVNLVWIDSIG